VTTDPQRDTPERMKRWLAAFDPAFVGLTGTKAELEAAQRAAGITPSVAQPAPGIAPTHIVTAGTLGAGDTNSSHDPKLNRIGAAMTAAGVKFTMRKGMLRFGFHCYNDETDVERVLEVVRGVR